MQEETNNCEAAQRLSVSEKLIRDWRKAQASGKWSGAHRDTHAIIGRGAFPWYPDLEKKLLTWIYRCRQEGYYN